MSDDEMSRVKGQKSLQGVPSSFDEGVVVDVVCCDLFFGYLIGVVHALAAEHDRTIGRFDHERLMSWCMTRSRDDPHAVSERFITMQHPERILRNKRPFRN